MKKILAVIKNWTLIGYQMVKKQVKQHPLLYLSVFCVRKNTVYRLFKHIREEGYLIKVREFIAEVQKAGLTQI